MMMPSVVLVRPQMGENIGAAARACMNFGLRDLRLVAPRDGWPNPKAHEMSAHADVIIEAAQVFDTLAEALADIQLAIAATARPRNLSLPVWTPREAAQEASNVIHKKQKAAFVFGPENNGLTSDEVAVMQAVMTIPADPANTSLNIAQSVVIAAYEWYQAAQATEVADNDDGDMLATHEEVEKLFEHLTNELDSKDFFYPEHRRSSLLRTIRTLLGRAQFTSPEVQTLRGIIRCLTNG